MRRVAAIVLTIMFIAGCESSPAHDQQKQQSVKAKTPILQGLNLDHLDPPFKKSDILLNSFRYDGRLLEELYLEDLSDSNYRNALINYLSTAGEGADNDKATLFTQLLLLRISQLKDSNAFIILNTLSRNMEISYSGIELLKDHLFDIFLQQPLLFIKQSALNNNTAILDYMSADLPDYFFTKEEYFINNFGYCDFKSGMRLVNSRRCDSLPNAEMKKRMEAQPKVEANFAPMLNNHWQSSTEYYYDVSKLMDSSMQATLSAQELAFFNRNYGKLLDGYKIRNYHIVDKDGYTNLRQGPAADTKVLARILNGAYVCYLADAGEWISVLDKDGNKGFIHKSRLKEL